MSAEKDWLGRGFRWPLTVDGRGAIAKISEEELVEQSIRVILGTAPGDYVLWPEFGCRANERIFDPASPDTIALLVADIRDALLRYEPRIDLIKVTGERNPVERSRIDITIHYVIRATRDEQVMTYPYYLEGGEESA